MGWLGSRPISFFLMLSLLPAVSACRVLFPIHSLSDLSFLIYHTFSDRQGRYSALVAAAD